MWLVLVSSPDLAKPSEAGPQPDRAEPWQHYHQQGHFWIHPIEPYFAMCNAFVLPDRVSLYFLYQTTIFLWLPHHLVNNDTILMCHNQSCQHYKVNNKPLSIKGWNDKLIAHRVVTLDGLYYVMTK
jgi:hypothetical protein